MSEIKDYGEMKPFFFYKNGHLDGESPSPIWGENENHAWNTHLEDLGVSREELEGEGYTLIEYRAELDNTKRDRMAWLLEQVDSFLCDPTSGVKLDRLTIAYENFVAEGGVGKRTITHSVDGLECELSINVKGRGDTQAVAPVGVVDEIRHLVYDVIDAARRCNNDPKPSKEYHAAWDAITAALARITELPEPSEGYSEWARLNVLNQGWTANELKQIAAALLESEGDHD